MKTLKRWGILTLCALLLTGLLTVPALAESAVPEAGKAMIGETQYNTLAEAIAAAQDGETIVLGEGLYTTYGAASPKKSLTFVGQGADKTHWGIGATMPDPAYFGTEYNGDYSFDSCNSITFKNMTLQSGAANYLGFIRINHTAVENCTINGKTFYWGYTTARFTNTTFNAPAGDYAIWTYSSPEMTFDGCTFHSSGKTINVYTDYGAGKNDITVNFKNCTVVSEKDGKCVMNINDSNMGNFKYRINIEGKNTVTGITPDNKDNKNGEKAEKDTSCSKLFEFKNATNNSGRTIVSIDGKVVWQDGKKTGHAIDTANDKYTDGYKDDAFDVTETMPWTEQADGSFLHKVRKVCQYCGFSEEVEERKQPEPTPSYTEPEAYPDYSETSAPTPTPTPTPVPAPDSDVAPKTGGNDGAAWVLALLAAGTAAFAMRKRARG